MTKKPHQTVTSKSAEQGSLDWAEIYHLLIEKRWLILGFLGFFMTLGNLYIELAIPLYEGVATVEVEQREQTAINSPGQQTTDTYQDLADLSTVESNFQRISLLKRVILRPEAQENPYLKAIVDKGIDSPKGQGSVAKIFKNIKAKLRRGTRLVDITVDHPDPATAQLIANLLVTEYLSENFNKHAGESEYTSQYLQDQAQTIQKKLEEIEIQLQDYSKLVDLHQRIMDARKQLDVLNQRYLEKYPGIQEAHALLDDLQKQFMQELSRREAAEQNAAGAPAPAPSVAPATSPIDPQQFERALVEEDSHYNVLLEEKETQRTLYDSVLDRLKEANISKGYEDAQVHVREAAIFPLYPSQPIIPLILAIAIFLGLVSGVGLAFTLNAMDSSFRTVDEAEHRLELHSLGAIPYVKGHDKEGTILVEDSNADQIVAESIRTLRASLKLMGRQEERKTFLFTSALPAEGKSFVTANCAVFLANEGSRVLIIDADLRKPTLHKIFNYSRSVEGLAEWLTRNEPLPNLVKPSPVPNLDVLVAGAPAPNPAELLSNCNFGILLSEAVQLYDYVLVDSAPIHAVGDTLLMCEYFQSTCLVIHAGNTPGSACVRALHLLEKAGAKMAGFILNRLPARAGYGSNSYYYYYQYSGKYGEAYGQAKAK